MRLCQCRWCTSRHHHTRKHDLRHWTSTDITTFKSPAFDEKRRVLVGRDLSVHRHDDLLKGVLDEKIKEINAGLNLSQLECLSTHCRNVHCRNVHHDINLILGPFGSGKISKLCELQKLRMPDSKTSVAASSNSACDAVISKFNLIVVRAHSLSLERETLLKLYFKLRWEGKLVISNSLSKDCTRLEPIQAVSN